MKNIFTALLTIFLLLLFVPIAFSQKMHITDPKDGTTVKQKYTVRGNSSDVGDNKIVLLVYSSKTNKWLFHGIAKIDSKGEWQANVVIGGENDTGGEFQIVAATMKKLPEDLREIEDDLFPVDGMSYLSNTVEVKRGK